MVAPTRQKCTGCNQEYWQGCLISKHGFLCDDCMENKTGIKKAKYENPPQELTKEQWIDFVKNQ